jgi:hypothetical protein
MFDSCMTKHVEGETPLEEKCRKKKKRTAAIKKLSSLQ